MLPKVVAQCTRNQFGYDMFLWPWDKLYEWQYWPQDNWLMRPKANKSATNLEFKPSRISTGLEKSVRMITSFYDP